MARAQCQLLYDLLISRHYKGVALIPEQARPFPSKARLPVAFPVAFQGAVTSLASQPQGAALGWQVQ